MREQAGAQEAVASLAQARASLSQEIANLSYAQTTLDRQNRLARDHAGTPTQRDLALSNYRQSEARIAQLRSQIAQTEAGLASASYGLEQRQIVAQTEGRVQDIYFREGEYAPAATPVIAVLAASGMSLSVSLLPEPELPRLKLGGTVRITCDGCKPMQAKVTFLAAREDIPSR